ncbi:hypothetical protein BN874_420046 [Candidatus Contendobacter odensis Run_B_J11]|uniref:Uncharacterized protein n=1 Tax=Candidatus Contendobacter odensis Run_B_J11 TaxID=1400861 RepID=A0A7U7GDV3_9GAMM|nr:hypothetical protein BN874_420046 [Candidatus Contendobacter odensis Run_B_J11]
MYGAVAGMAIEEASDRFAYRQGLFMLVGTGLKPLDLPLCRVVG